MNAEVNVVAIARKLIVALEWDNYGSQDKHFERGQGPIPARVAGAIASMYGHGCDFTEEDIQQIAGGESSETESMYRKYPGWQTLDNWLNYVFGEQDEF